MSRALLVPGAIIAVLGLGVWVHATRAPVSRSRAPSVHAAPADRVASATQDELAQRALDSRPAIAEDVVRDAQSWAQIPPAQDRADFIEVPWTIEPTERGDRKKPFKKVHQPALCDERCVMSTILPSADWQAFRVGDM